MPENLPAVPADTDVDSIVYDGEVVGDAPPLPAVRAVALSPHAVRVLRHGGYVLAGVVVIARKWHHRRMRYHRAMDAAEATGDHETMHKWATLHEQARHQKHQRLTGRVEAFVALVKVFPWVLAAWLIAMGLTGVFLSIARKNWGDLAWPWLATAHAVNFGVTLAALLALPVMLTATVATFVLLYYHGRNGGNFAPGWTVAGKPEEQDRGLVVTADSIVLALQNIPGPQLKAAFKNEWRPSFHTLPVRDGEGYTAVFSVPLGVTAEMIADQVEIFARNLHRAKTEVWPTDAEREKIAPAGYVALWVANPGVLDRPAPEYPLMHEGSADVFTGVPGGVVARGDGALIPVVAANLVLGGQMGNGKSNGCRVFMLGCATDPLCVLHVFVFANNGDFDAFAPRLATYGKGTEDDTVTAAVNHLHELLEEVGRREGRLAALGAKKLTRGIAGQYPDMRPSVTLFSECHELFSHPDMGELAAELAVKVIKRARKTGVVLVFDTQSSRKGAIPPALVELVSVNGCFYVKSWRSNDGFLGDGAFQAGIRATELRPGRDRGRSVMTGISDAQFELLKWYFIEVDDDTGYDAASEVIARCMKTVAPGTAVAGNSPIAAIEIRDLLDDLAEVLDGPDRVRLADLPPRLRKLAPTWGPYRNLTGMQLREALDDEGVRTTNVGNVPRLDPEDLRRRLAEGE